jgi:phage-related protein
MAEDFTVVGVIKVGGDGTAKIEGLGKTIGGLETKTRGVEGATSTLGSAMSFVWGNLIVKGVELAAQKAVEFGKEFIDAATKSQNEVAQLNAVIKSTGGAAGVTAEEAIKLAEGFQKTTKFSKEQTLSAEDMLLTFTNIKKDVFPAATETVLNMSQALGQDLKSSSIQLGKALQDPVEGVTALKRVGVNFTDAQRDMIKSMVESGRVADAQALIMGELKTEFGGSAVAAGKTFSGQMEILKNRMGEVQETIGLALLPVLTKLMDKVIVPLIPYIEKAGEQFAGWISSIGKADFSSVFSGVVEFIQPIVDALSGLFMVIQSTMPRIKQYGADMWAFLQGAFSAVGPTIIGNISTVIKTIADIWAKHGEEIMAVVNFMFRTIVAVIGGAMAIISGVITAGMKIVQGIINVVSAVIKGDWQGAWDAIVNMLKGVWLTIGGALTAFMNMALSIVGTNLKAFTGVWVSNFNALKTIVSKSLDNIVGAIVVYIANFIKAGKDLITGLGKGAETAIVSVIAKIKGYASSIIDAVKAILGISSPSKVFMNIGVNMMRGWEKGITDGMTLPLNAVMQSSSGLAYVGATSGISSADNSFRNHGIVNIYASPDSDLTSLLRQARRIQVQ